MPKADSVRNTSSSGSKRPASQRAKPGARKARRSGDRAATAKEMAATQFGPQDPPFRVVPATIEGWLEQARHDFATFSMVEYVLKHDDKSLTARLGSTLEGAEGALEMLKCIEPMAKRWEAGAQFLKAAEARLLVALSRGEQQRKIIAPIARKLLKAADAIAKLSASEREVDQSASTPARGARGAGNKSAKHPVAAS